MGDPRSLAAQVDELRNRVDELQERLSAPEGESICELFSQLKAQQASLDEMARSLGDMEKANKTLQQALGARREGSLCMFESHEGVVMEVGEDSVVVTYSVNGEYVDQTYRKEQFIGGRLPKKGDRLAVYVHVAELPKERPEEETSERTGDEERKHRKHATRPPREF